MDLEGVAALSAAAVALIGVPAALVVGRWQFKAALRSAEATSEAGIAQAESVYRAALDTARAEAKTIHLHWRRSIQREAYASFLLAVQRLKEVAERFAADNEEVLSAESIAAGKTSADDALAALKAAQTIIELEGPDDVAAPAAVMTDAAQEMSRYLRAQAVYARAWGKLSRSAENPSTVLSAPAIELLQRLSHLRLVHGAEPFGPTGADACLVHERNAARGACYEAQIALPSGTLDDDELDALIAGHSRFPPALGERYFDAVRQFDEAEGRFIRAAKVELHGLGSA
ncbi:hypothetical protein [Streptomyces sp. AK02-01A]|uniref:hypothetical protein n=1 Tax=Streptomyces sp. AK02-01A TaxID=3028648 RepID=UPI0029B6A9AD|nr:hypothetical protein [Streptomyces sp. AK02-01A]MDX3854221.1 hypothetical protein [Streptomyces sp. AK02-01A]